MNKRSVSVRSLATNGSAGAETALGGLLFLWPDHNRIVWRRLLIFSACDASARVKNMTTAPRVPRHIVTHVVCGLQPLRSGKPFAASPITATIGDHAAS
jgi:hypothetical protein